jgi:hypothetical protein
MSSILERYWISITSAIIIVGVLFLSIGSQWIAFPAFEYSSGGLGRQLVPVDPYNDIAGMASRFLWENRALDLTGQAFVIVAAVICCLAMIKPEKGGS